MWGKIKVTGDNWMYPKPMYDLSGWQLRSAACGGVTTSIASEFKVRVFACARACVCSLARLCVCLRVHARVRASPRASGCACLAGVRPGRRLTQARASACTCAPPRMSAPTCAGG